MPAARTTYPRWTWIPVLFLLLLCLLRGLWVARGLTSPAIMDTFRDAGFVQGILDGNWLGDPTVAGAWRYYPPLVHLVFAAVAGITGSSPLHLLMLAAPWTNLVVPLGFFLMARRLLGAPAAACGTALLVLVNGYALSPWVSAAYHPWSSTPMLALGGFFLSLWLIHARVRSEELGDAALIGTAIGLTFLAHTVPALILALILPAAVASVRGVNRRTVSWVGLAAAMTLAWSLPLLLPLLVSYRLHIANTVGATFTDPLFAAWPPNRRMLFSLLPGLAGLPIIVALRREAGLSRLTLVMLGVWLAVPALFLTRHYACGAGSRAAACTVLVLAVHHWFIYLQAALTCVGGLAAWLVLQRLLHGRSPQRGVIAVGGVAAAACAIALMCLRPTDVYMRQRARDLGRAFDWDAYAWITAHTAPHDVFVTELPDQSLNPASLAVMAAGRSSVALPPTYSNPYVEWEPRNDRSLRYLAAAGAPLPEANRTLCELIAEARPGTAYIILATARPVPSPVLRTAAAGSMNTIYRVMPDACGAAR